ncbi:hypothetical protein Bca4012_063661 [Brassica carinata]
MGTARISRFLKHHDNLHQLRTTVSFSSHPRPLSDLSSTISLNYAVDSLSHFCCILFSSSSRYITSAVLFD